MGGHWGCPCVLSGSVQPFRHETRNTLDGLCRVLHTTFRHYEIIEATVQHQRVKTGFFQIISAVLLLGENIASSLVPHTGWKICRFFFFFPLFSHREQMSLSFNVSEVKEGGMPCFFLTNYSNSLNLFYDFPNSKDNLKKNVSVELLLWFDAVV